MLEIIKLKAIIRTISTKGFSTIIAMMAPSGERKMFLAIGALMITSLRRK